MSEEPYDSPITYQEMEITWFIHRGYVIYKCEDTGRWFVQGREHLVYLHQDGPIAAIDFEYMTLMREVCKIEQERSKSNHQRSSGKR